MEHTRFCRIILTLLFAVGLISACTLHTNPPSIEPTMTQLARTAEAGVTLSARLTLAALPTATSTPRESASPTALPAQITDAYGVEMALIPAGEFLMGCDADVSLAECQKPNSNCPRSWFENEEPVHTVFLDDYYIDIYEVSNARYNDCVAARKCYSLEESRFYTMSNYYGNPQYANYPVINITWLEAETYCEWRGGRLPTEAEWEKAARGGLEGALYPWGNEAPVRQMGAPNGANFGRGVEALDFNKGTPDPVGTYPPNDYGLYDMAGNVDELVMDWYMKTFYSISPYANPTGPKSGEYRVTRGGSWKTVDWSLLVSKRGIFKPYARENDTGFRCVRSLDILDSLSPTGVPGLTVSPTVAVSTPATSQTTPGALLATPGMTANAEWQVAVLSATREPQLEWNAGLLGSGVHKLKAGFVFLVIDIQLTKLKSEEEYWLDSQYFTVTDGQGNTYELIGGAADPFVWFVVTPGYFQAPYHQSCGEGCEQDYEFAPNGSWRVRVKGSPWRQIYLFLIPANASDIRFTFRDLPSINLGQ